MLKERKKRRFLKREEKQVTELATKLQLSIQKPFHESSQLQLSGALVTVLTAVFITLNTKRYGRETQF